MLFGLLKTKKDKRIRELEMELNFARKHKHNILGKIAKKIMKNMMDKDAAGGE